MMKGDTDRRRDIAMRGLPGKSLNGCVSSSPRTCKTPSAVVAGGAGFIGAHLCERLLADGYRVYCVDSFYTGLERNIAHLVNAPRFVVMEHEVRSACRHRQGDEVYTWPVRLPAATTSADPVHSLTTNVLGTLNLIEMDAARQASFFQASTARSMASPRSTRSLRVIAAVSARLARAPATTKASGRPEALCYDFRRTSRRRRADGEDLQHLRPACERRRPHHLQIHHPGCADSR
jgi:UDP-glucuronate decarboxylase